MEISESLVTAVVTGVLSVGVAWGVLRRTLTTHEERIKAVEESRADHLAKITDLRIVQERHDGRLKAVEKLEDRVVSYDEFNGRMSSQDQVLRGQDTTLKRIEVTLQRKVSIPASHAAALDPRQEPDSDPPRGAAPMRPRLPSRGGGG